jgi:hypothetical protein
MGSCGSFGTWGEKWSGGTLDYVPSHLNSATRLVCWLFDRSWQSDDVGGDDMDWVRSLLVQDGCLGGLACLDCGVSVGVEVDSFMHASGDAVRRSLHIDSSSARTGHAFSCKFRNRNVCRSGA